MIFSTLHYTNAVEFVNDWFGYGVQNECEFIV